MQVWVRSYFRWFCFLLLLLAGGFHSCSAGPPCDSKYGKNQLDPKGSPCKKDCECNNQAYEGYCIEGKCVALKRSACDSPGTVENCKLQPIFAPSIGDCGGESGTKTCAEEGLPNDVWGNCTCPTKGEKASEPRSEPKPESVIPDRTPEREVCKVKGDGVGPLTCKSSADCCPGQRCVSQPLPALPNLCGCSEDADCPRGYICCQRRDKYCTLRNLCLD